MVSIMKFNYLICVYMTLQCLSMHWQSEAIRAQIHSLTVFHSSRLPLVSITTFLTFLNFIILSSLGFPRLFRISVSACLHF